MIFSHLLSKLLSQPFDHEDPNLELIQAPEGERGYASRSSGAIRQLESSLHCLFNNEDLAFDGGLYYMQSIGQEIELSDCPATLGEHGEGTGDAGAVITPLCACEQSLYWAQQAGYACAEEELIYFYHPDYLGSVEYITDMRGEPYQFFLNTPWGENLENQFAKNYTSFSSRFRFNGKEWDEETGNYYYGARYYDPQTSIWLSVDELAHKYPELTPYDYVANNPINLVDPDGRDIWRVKNGRLKLYKKTEDNYNVFQNQKGTEVFRTNQQVNWSSRDRLVNESIADFKEIVGLIADDPTAQNTMKDRAAKTGWDDSQYCGAGDFVDRMKDLSESQDIADAIGIAKDVAMTKAPGGVPGYDDVQIAEKINELANDGETIPETVMRNGQQAIDNGQSFWSDLKSSVKSTINNIENAVKNGQAPW